MSYVACLLRGANSRQRDVSPCPVIWFRAIQQAKKDPVGVKDVGDESTRDDELELAKCVSGDGFSYRMQQESSHGAQCPI